MVQPSSVSDDSKYASLSINDQLIISRTQMQDPAFVASISDISYQTPSELRTGASVI